MTSTRARSADPLVRYGVMLEDPPDMTVEVDRVGPSYVATVEPLGAQIVFREIRLDREPAAEVSFSSRAGLNGRRRHLFRTTSTLSLHGRKMLAKTAHEISKASDAETWQLATFAAVEKVMDAETVIETIDLRKSDTSTKRAIFVAGHFLVDGPSLVVAPGESGKSTIARAIAVGFAAHREVVVGIAPRAQGPVLYVAAEAPLVASHRRSIEAICRGIGLDPKNIDHPIDLYPTHGKPLHRIARSLAEKAADYALVVLDSFQALQTVSEHSAGIRERDTIFWNAVDQIDKPTLIIAHPNREDAQRWNRSDGRAAGSDVTRDRSRISWKATFRDEASVAGQSFRRYTFRCTKYNDGPRPGAFGIGVNWVHGTTDEDPGTVYFTEVDPEVRAPRVLDDEPIVAPNVSEADLSAAQRETLAHWRAGLRTPTSLMSAIPGLSYSAAKKRLDRFKEWAAQRAEATESNVIQLPIEPGPPDE